MFTGELRTLAGGSNDRWTVAIALAKARDPRCLGLLERFLFDGFHTRSIQAIQQLGELGGMPGAAEPLIRLMTHDYRAGESRFIESFSEGVPTEGAIGAMRERRSAIEALGRLGEPEALMPLMGLLPRSNEISIHDLDFSLCQSTIAALINIIERAHVVFGQAELMSLAEWPDCEFLGWREDQNPPYSVLKTPIQSDCHQLREIAKRVLESRATKSQARGVRPPLSGLGSV